MFFENASEKESHMQHDCLISKRFNQVSIHLLERFLEGLSLETFYMRLLYLINIGERNIPLENGTYTHVSHIPDWVWHIILRIWDNDYEREYNNNEFTRDYFEGLCEGMLMSVRKVDKSS